MDVVKYTISRFRSFSLGELPPPAPRACFGREESIEEVVGFVETLESVALIGAGGIGKTTIVLAALHHERTNWPGSVATADLSVVTSCQPHPVTSPPAYPRSSVRGSNTLTI